METCTVLEDFNDSGVLSGCPWGLLNGENLTSNNPLSNLLCYLSMLWSLLGERVSFWWVPSHVGVWGNECAAQGGRLLGSGTRLPTPFPALRAHLVAKGQ